MIRDGIEWVKEIILSKFRKPCGCSYDNVRYLSKNGRKSNMNTNHKVTVSEEDIVEDTYTEFEWVDYGSKERKKKVLYMMGFLLNRAKLELLVLVVAIQIIQLAVLEITLGSKMVLMLAWYNT